MKPYEATEAAYKNGYTKGFEDGKKAVANQVASSSKQLASSKWIPVTERLPEMYKNVLVIRTDGKIRFDAIGSLGVWYEEVWHTGNPVTHWMPLPQPPKGE